MTDIFAFGLGIARYSASGTMLDCFFPQPLLTPDGELAQAITELPTGASEISANQAHALNQASGSDLLAEKLADSAQHLIAVRLDSDTAIASTAEAYLKLHLLSHRLCLPNSLNLDGIFAHLPNIAWTSAGPIAVEDLPEAISKAHLENTQLEVFAVDKFPKMVNYVVPALSLIHISEPTRPY